MPLISYFPSAAGGASIDYNSRPQIDFDGKWLKWFVEFYSGEPYWEAWFFSSGTLTLSQGYTIDAWGLGGGGANYRGDGSLAGAGMPTMALGCKVPAGSVAVTIGAGADAHDGRKYGAAKGGNTSFGSYLTAQGGQYADLESEHDYDAYNRFGDATRNEAAHAPFEDYEGDVYELGGWLDFACPGRTTEVHGIGAGGYSDDTSGSYGGSGALVIRIKI